MDIHRVLISEVRDEGENIRSFYFDAPEGFDWSEGAHIHVALPGYDEGGAPHKELVRHMSIMTLPEEGRMGFATRLDSSDSAYKRALSRLGVGDALTLFKPGACLALRREERPIVVFSMGVAMTAVRPLALRYARDGRGVPSLTSVTVNSRAVVPFEDELRALGAPGISLVRLRHRGELASAIDTACAGNPICYAVGSDEFLCGVITRLRARGVSDADIVIDKKPEKRQLFYENYGLSAQ